MFCQTRRLTMESNLLNCYDITLFECIKSLRSSSSIFFLGAMFICFSIESSLLYVDLYVDYYGITIISHIYHNNYYVSMLCLYSILTTLMINY